MGIGGTGVIRASMILAWAALQEGFKVRTTETYGMAQRGGSVISYLKFGHNTEGPFMIEGDVDVLLAFEISEALRNINFVNKDTLIISSISSIIPPSVLNYRKLAIDLNKCIGCGNCIAQCIPNDVFLHSSNTHHFTLLSGPTRKIINGHSYVLDSCTGCLKCIIDNVCPFRAIEARNEFSYPNITFIEKDIKSVVSNVIFLDSDKLAMDVGNILTANVIILGVLAGTGRFPIKNEYIRKAVEFFVPQKALVLNLRAFDIGVNIGLKYKKKKQ